MKTGWMGQLKTALTPVGMVSYKSKTQHFFIKLFLYALLFGVVYAFLFPFLYMIITSMKSSSDLSDITVNWIPSSIKTANFVIAAKALNYGNALKNTAILTVTATLGHLLSCSMAGYAFARYKFKGRGFLFFLVLLSIVVPIQTLIIPTYLLFSDLKMINTMLPMIIPTYFGMGLRGGLFIFIFRQFFLGLPKELEEAAKIDGCSFLKAFFVIVLPIAKPILLVTSVLSVVWHWNASYEPSIYISREAIKPLASKIDVIVEYVTNPPQELFDSLASSSSEQVINVAVLMAGCFLILFPLILMFAVVQHYFMEGIERSGLVE